MKKYQKLERFPLGSILADGFLKEQLERNKNGIGGHLDELEPGMIADPFINKTPVRQWSGGDQSGWGGEISGNYWTGLIELAFTLNDEKLIKKATNWVNTMMKKQKPDGYLGTYFEEDALIFEDYNAWGTSCAMRGLLAFYEATCRKDVLDAVHRCMLWFCKNWAGDKKTVYCGHSIIEILVFCYQKTGDERLIAFAEEYSDYLCEHDIFSVSYKAFLSGELQYNSNHTAGYGISIRLPALLYSATGNKDYLRASEKVIEKIRRKATQLTGAPVSVAEYLGPKGSVNETEYCSFTFFNAAFSYMSYITGDSKYCDYMEEMFYNGAQGARKKDERAIAYLSAPNQIYATENSSGAVADMQVYAPCYPVACCPVNSVAVLPEFVRGMFLHDADGNIYASLYGPCTLEYGKTKLREETKYPFRDTVEFFAESDIESGVFLRIPDWCREYKIKINGSAASVSAPQNGYVKVSERLAKGDKITVNFSMHTEVIEVDDGDSSSKYPLCIKRGPLVYSLPIKEKWEACKGHPETPLPDGWSWYNVLPDYREADVHDPHERLGLRKNQITWNAALDENITPESISVEEVESEKYVWECPPIKLHLKGYKAPFLCAPYPIRTFEPFGKKQKVTSELDLTLVPYGCTNLRITYFPRADMENYNQSSD